MKLPILLQATAQAKADAIHAWLISNDSAYAASVSKGQTVRWAIPRNIDDAGNPIVGWHVVVKNRALGALTALEIASLLP